MVCPVQPGIIHDHIEILRPVLRTVDHRRPQVCSRITGDILILQAKPHIVASRACGNNLSRVAVRQILEIHIPEPGDILAILISVIDLDNNILRFRILEHKRNLLLESDRVLRQMELNPRAVDIENALSVIAVIKSFNHLFESDIPRSHGLKRRICRERIVNIVRRARCGIDMHSIHIKGIQLVLQLDLLRCIIRLRTFPAAVRTVVNAQLTIVEEIIFQLLPAIPAEDALPYLRT